MADAGLDKAGRRVSAMFDRVARRYDVTNTVISAGLDRWWRRELRFALGLRPGERCLDLAAGTAVSSVELARSGAAVVACDFSLGMLRGGLHRGYQGRGRPDTGVRLVAGDALALPFRDETFDAVTIAFGLRNVADVPRALREMRRVTRPGGRLVVCEFSRPPWAPYRAAYDMYRTRVIPAVADVVSSDAAAYRYLATSIGRWPDQEGLAASLVEAGWRRVAWRNLTGGVVALHRGLR